LGLKIWKKEEVTPDMVSKILARLSPSEQQHILRKVMLESVLCLRCSHTMCSMGEALYEEKYARENLAHLGIKVEV